MMRRAVLISIVLLASFGLVCPAGAGELQFERIFGPEVKTGP